MGLSSCRIAGTVASFSLYRPRTRSSLPPVQADHAATTAVPWRAGRLQTEHRGLISTRQQRGTARSRLLKVQPSGGSRRRRGIHVTGFSVIPMIGTARAAGRQTMVLRANTVWCETYVGQTIDDCSRKINVGLQSLIKSL